MVHSASAPPSLKFWPILVPDEASGQTSGQTSGGLGSQFETLLQFNQRKELDRCFENVLIKFDGQKLLC